jgi:hypothetical protein
MTHQLFDIWENPERTTFAWHVQMVNYVGHFNTRKLAESFVEAVKRQRAQEATAVR